MTKTTADTPGARRALVINPSDNVANVIGAAHPGDVVTCAIEGQRETESIEMVGELPANHKIARRDIAAGEDILKYGLSIGVASRDIRRGEHVHTHNIESKRGRGDLQGAAQH